MRNGMYFINDVPLAQSAFARDPEHPRWTSRVAELLGRAASEERLFVPDVTCIKDVTARANEMDVDALPAGGADFFEAILKAKGGHSCAPRHDSAMGPTLFVCGSAAAWDNGRAAQCVTCGIPIVSMPEQIFSGDVALTAMNEWCVEASTALRDHGRVMLAIGRLSINRSKLPSNHLAERLADAVARVLATEKVERFCIEGGATAAALLQKFGWTRLAVSPVDSPGVAALSVTGGPTLLIKPGSYPWPRSVLAMA